MDDAPPPTPSADKALARLRALAQGNGLAPEKITLVSADEKIYTFEGTTTLTPLCEAQEQRYDGPPRGKKLQMLPSFAALHADAKKRQDAFKSRTDWMVEATAELHKAPGQGWGLDAARIELPNHSVALAATETCKTCQGRKNITCERCQGRGYELCAQCKGLRQEFCYYCNYNNSGSGSGQIPAGQLCLVCNGRRHIPCRTCHATGQTPCPLCQARGGSPCPACNGVGQMTQEIHITCGATARFQFKGDGLPTGLRRGLDRLGIANLSKGHAEIILAQSKEEEEPETHEVIPGGLVGVAPTSASGAPPPETNDDDSPEDTGFGAPHPVATGTAQPVIHYKARMPFADLRIDFGGKKGTIGVFGLHGALLDVPPFLDTFLAPSLEKLEKATKGRGTVYDALETRVLRETLELAMQGKGTLKEFRHLYPFGISNQIADNILRGAAQSVKRLTLRIRAVASIVIGALSAGIFTACFFTPLLVSLMQNPGWGEIAFDFGPLIVAEGLGWGLFNLAACLDLRRHFPNTKIGFRQTIGKIGYGTLTAIVVIWLIMLALSPARPLWLPLLVH